MAQMLRVIDSLPSITLISVNKRTLLTMILVEDILHALFGQVYGIPDYRKSGIP